MNDKIGIGVYGNFPDEVLADLIKMRPNPIMLTNPPPGFYRRLRDALGPSFSIGLRLWVDENVQLAWLSGDILPRARDYADQAIRAALTMPGLNWIASLNETPCKPLDMIKRLDIFQGEFVHLVQTIGGYPVVGCNFGVGNPQVGAAVPPYDPRNNPFTSMLSVTGPYAAKLTGIHAYGAFDPHDPTKSLPMDDPDTMDWYALRHRFFAKDINAAGQKAVFYLATESGSNQPWKGQYTAQEYFRQVAWFQDRINEDSAKGIPITGQCLFGLWGVGGDPQFAGWDIHGTEMVDLITGYNATH